MLPLELCAVRFPESLSIRILPLMVCTVVVPLILAMLTLPLELLIFDVTALSFPTTILPLELSRLSLPETSASGDSRVPLDVLISAELEYDAGK